MKKILSLLVVAVLMLGMMSMSASAARDLKYTAQYGSATIDGVYEDAWDINGSAWTEIDLPFDGSLDTVCAARAKMMHDDSLIYFFVEITDATLANSPDLDLTAMDQFEIYLDEDACKDVAYCENSYQLGMTLAAEVRAGTNADAVGAVDCVKEFKVGTSENGYTLEFSVAPLNGIPAADKAIGLEFMYNDCDETGAFIEALRWNVDTAAGDTAPWQAPECWGELYCAEYVAPAEPEVPAEDAPAADTTAPTTADAGIVVAAVVMAAAAAVVCKKH
jgi:uncharacterized protein YceK